MRVCHECMKAIYQPVTALQNHRIRGILSNGRPTNEKTANCPRGIYCVF